MANFILKDANTNKYIDIDPSSGYPYLVQDRRKAKQFATKGKADRYASHFSGSAYGYRIKAEQLA